MSVVRKLVVRFRSLLVATMVVVVAGCSSAAVVGQTASSDKFRQEAVKIPASDLSLTGLLFTPESAVTPRERRPAIVLLHGCGGMLNNRGQLAARHRDWADRFASWGFVALTLDSFAARGHGSICELKDRPIQPWTDRTRDAYAALNFLVARPDVDAAAVLVLGWSHGGSTVMGIVRPEAPGRSPAGPHFKAAIAFYPGCTQPLRLNNFRSTMPMLILHGTDDDWTPVAPCLELSEKSKTAGLPIQIITYAGAVHGFDQPFGQVNLLPNVYNPAMPGGRGAQVGRHPQARLSSIDDAKRFVEQQLGRRVWGSADR